MMKAIWSRPVSLFRFTFVRFGVVALFGEGIYFLLYGFLIQLTNSTSKTLAIAGGICILLNAYIHSRITFAVNFTWRLLLGYLQIQLIGFGLAFVIGLILEAVHAGKWIIALVTYALWSCASYILTRVLYRAEGNRFGRPSVTSSTTP
jgi:hypothetical protein